MAKKTTSRPTLISSQKEAAAQLGVTDRNLRNWMQRPGFPDCGAGYDLDAIKKWRQENALKGSKVARAMVRTKLRSQQQQLRIKRAEADRREREEMAAKGDILNRETYELFLIECLQEARDAFLRLARLACRHVPKKFHPTLQPELEADIRKILEKLARDLERGPDKHDLKRPAGKAKKDGDD